MDADDHLREGRLDECLATLQQTVRSQPADARSRAFLFELLFVLGQWERAANQLEVLANLNADTLLLARLYQTVIQCEVLRGEVFAGRRAPVIFGEPAEWI